MLAVVRYNGTLYVCEFDTEQKLNDMLLEDERQKEMTYWGFKFEQYITSGKLVVTIVTIVIASVRFERTFIGLSQI